MTDIIKIMIAMNVILMVYCITYPLILIHNNFPYRLLPTFIGVVIMWLYIGRIEMYVQIGTILWYHRNDIERLYQYIAMDNWLAKYTDCRLARLPAVDQDNVVVTYYLIENKYKSYFQMHYDNDFELDPETMKKCMIKVLSEKNKEVYINNTYIPPDIINEVYQYL